ncbi:MAG: SDR family oxidoreductase [Gammaproteobacteria bacterium]|nr:SDR family oxidoreductase [Gammaproteobacteria bacterium]
MKNKTILITGGASGLGFAIANDLHTSGQTVVIFDINADSLNRVDDVFDKYQVDVTNYDAVQTAVDTVVESHGRIDVLINSAGIIHSEPIINILNPTQRKHSFHSFRNVLKLNLESVFIVTSIVAETMVLKRTKGCIINISSISAQGNAGQTAYSAAKGGVESMTKTWGKELGLFGIRTNVISPGFIDTPSTELALNAKTIDHIIQNTPLRKLGDTKSICQTVRYLMENDFVNATVTHVDGGLSL